MPRLPRTDLATSFLAYLHYLEDLAGVIGGLYGLAPTVVHGIYAATAVAPADGPAPAAPVLRTVNDHLWVSWRHLVRLEQLADPGLYDRQVNAVAPRFALSSIVASARALAAAEEVALDDAPGDALEWAAGRISEGLLPPPWHIHCLGVPQTGSALVRGVRPGAVSVFAAPDPATSDARLALLLRTTRRRTLEDAFAAARQQGVRPGRSRRNLPVGEKESIAAATVPTTLLDVFVRLHERAREDDGEAFVHGPFDAVEAYRFTDALWVVTDATVAALEAALARRVGGEMLAELAASAARRSANPSPALARRVAAAGRTGVSPRPGSRA